MRDKNTMIDVDAQQPAAVSHHKLYVNVLAALICLLIAVLVWVSVMNSQDTDYVPLRIENPQSNVTYEFSADDLQVQGIAVGVYHKLKE